MAETAIQTSSQKSPGLAERRIRQILANTGVEINGPNPWDIQLRNQDFFPRVALKGSLGLGESYMDGWWEAEQVDELVNRLLRAPGIQGQKFATHILSYLENRFRNLQKETRAFQVGEEHYDLGNDIYEAMLDKRMVYTCGYWQDADDLDRAQQQKLELTCRKLDLKPGMRILDIGCGWGSLAKYAAENFGVEVVGITVSREQVELGNRRCQGLPVELRLQDYRQVNETFDAIVSLGMFEHVGHKNYRIYMEMVERCLGEDGLFLLHTIGKNDTRIGVDPWIGKYIFPNGEIPSLRQISDSLENLMVIEDLHNFGPDYDKTLMAWFNNFNRAWPELKNKYPERFYRMWKYYLQVCAGAFRARDLQLWQVVISKRGRPTVYRRPAI